MKKNIIIVLVTSLYYATGFAGNLLIDNVSLEPGETANLKISLSSVAGNYVGLQFDLTLPDGFSLEKGDDGNVYKLSTIQADNMEISVKDLGSGSKRFVFYSNTLEPFKEGEFLTFNIKANSNLSRGIYTISVNGVAFSDVNGKVIKESEVNAQAEVIGNDIIIIVKSHEREYGAANPKFEYSIEGGEFEGIPEITCEATESSPVGTYDIVVTEGSVTSPNVTYVKGTLTITKAPLKIKAGTYTRKQGEENPEFTLTYEGFKNNETEEVLTKKPTVTTTATKKSTVGDYTVTVSGAEAQNYEITYENGVLTVTAVIKGDANDDGEVDEKDIVDIANYMMGKQTSTGKFNEMAADINEDGVVNIADVVQIVKVIVK